MGFIRMLARLARRVFCPRCDQHITPDCRGCCPYCGEIVEK